jgi:tRNA1Val (adenine37-N6)-methyltransferase
MFHFKQFSIDDSTCAMKVGTDAVLLGSWIQASAESRILDIGTGCGILALMMAQRNPGIPVDAVEVDPDAAAQAEGNARLSPWSDKVQVFSSSIQEFTVSRTNTYSLIVSNPPFFTKSGDPARNLARHTDSLPLRELISCCIRLLEPNGRAAFIFPAGDLPEWTAETMSAGLYPASICFVRSTPEHKPHRVMAVFSNTPPASGSETEFIIYDSGRKRSPEYQAITRDFYL